MKNKSINASFFIVVIMLFSNLAFALEDDELGCIVGNCTDGRGVFVSVTEEHGETRYTGNFSEGQYNGYGRLELVDEGLTYKGRWDMGIKNGRGIQWDKDNNVYMGQWQNDRRNGAGSQFFKVEGWVEDEHGEEWLIANTENFTGGFKNDVFYGQGTYHWNDGTVYVGGWAAGKRHGDGYYEFGRGIRSFRKFEFDVPVYD